MFSNTLGILSFNLTKYEGSDWNVTIEELGEHTLESPKLIKGIYRGDDDYVNGLDNLMTGVGVWTSTSDPEELDLN